MRIARGATLNAYAVLAVVVVAVCLIMSYALTNGAPKDVQKGELYVTGDLFGSGMSYNEDAGIATLVYESGGDEISWEVSRLDGPVFEKGTRNTYILRNEAESVDGKILRIDEPGRYDVKLFVDGELSRHGTAILGGYVERHYAWTQDDAGKDFEYSLDFAYPYSSVLRCMESNIIRESSEGMPMTAFVKVDDAVTLLESALKKEYRNVRGQSASISGQDYADYLLSFVQCCFAEPDPISVDLLGRFILDRHDGSGDMFLYGQEEYNAFPAETIHMGMGDGSDTAFLMVALFSVAGYHTGLASIGGSEFAYVALTDFAPTDQGKGYAMVSKRMDSNGYNIFICDSSSEVSRPVGYMPNSISSQATASMTVEPYVKDGGMLYTNTAYIDNAGCPPRTVRS